MARKLVKESKKITAPRWAALRSDFQGVYPFVKGPIVAEGETIGTTLPFLGGAGIGKAMKSGLMAAEAINASLDSNDIDKLIKYSQNIESELKPFYGVTGWPTSG